MSASSTWLLATYYATLGVLAFYGTHRLMLLTLYYRTRRQQPPLPSAPLEWPIVTVQLPLFNEMYVAARLIDAAAGLDYPVDRLEIQVLDDSTDETRDIVAGRVAHHQSQGVNIQHLHRIDRQGFKAGALAAGAEVAQGEFLAIFDADFLPQSDFLRQTIPYLSDPDNPNIGMVQACWDHINRDYSLLTRIQAIFLDGHFLIEHSARNRSGRFFNFNGTAGVWRRRTIEEAGGWQHDTLTEDLDLSYRAQLAGWKFLFLPDVRVPAELPVDINGFKRQQFRWAKGSIQTARKLLGRILRAPIPWKVKLEAFIHLTNNCSYALMILLSVLIFPAMIVRWGSGWRALLLVDAPLFLAATVSVLAFYVASQAAAQSNWRHELRRLPAVMGMGIGLAVNNARAVLEGCTQMGGVFERTPKYAIEGADDRWKHKHYRSTFHWTFPIEVAFAAYFVACFALAWGFGMWLSLPFLYLFLQGHCYIVFLTLAGRWRPHHC